MNQMALVDNSSVQLLNNPDFLAVANSGFYIVLVKGYLIFVLSKELTKFGEVPSSCEVSSKHRQLPASNDMARSSLL